MWLGGEWEVDLYWQLYQIHLGSSREAPSDYSTLATSGGGLSRSIGTTGALHSEEDKSLLPRSSAAPVPIQYFCWIHLMLGEPAYSGARWDCAVNGFVPTLIRWPTPESLVTMAAVAVYSQEGHQERMNAAGGRSGGLLQNKPLLP